MVPLVDADDEERLQVEEIRPPPDLLDDGHLPVPVGLDPQRGQQCGRGQCVCDHLCSLLLFNLSTEQGAQEPAESARARLLRGCSPDYPHVLGEDAVTLPAARSVVPTKDSALDWPSMKA